MVNISKEKEAAFLKFYQIISCAAWNQTFLFLLDLIIISYIHTSIVDKNSPLFFFYVYTLESCGQLSYCSLVVSQVTHI